MSRLNNSKLQTETVVVCSCGKCKNEIESCDCCGSPFNGLAYGAAIKCFSSKVSPFHFCSKKCLDIGMKMFKAGRKARTRTDFDDK